jgi:hypothetical protein
MSEDKYFKKLKSDAKDLAISAAGHVPILGSVLGTYDTVKKGQKFAASASQATKHVKRKIVKKRKNVQRKLQRYF